jgi:hypothetical protein
MRARPEVAWLGREDSNLRMAEPKSAALPLGYAPTQNEPCAPGLYGPLAVRKARLGARTRRATSRNGPPTRPHVSCSRGGCGSRVTRQRPAHSSTLRRHSTACRQSLASGLRAVSDLALRVDSEGLSRSQPGSRLIDPRDAIGHLRTGLRHASARGEVAVPFFTFADRGNCGPSAASGRCGRSPCE